MTLTIGRVQLEDGTIPETWELTGEGGISASGIVRAATVAEASQRLPPTLAGQLIVFETLSALAYAFVLRGQAPQAQTLAGVALLVAGVAWAVRSRPEPESAEAHPN